MLVRVTFLIVKNQCLSAKPCVLTEIVRKTLFFDKQCNQLEVWLKERGYSDRLMRGKSLKARKFSKSEVLNKRKRVGNNSRFAFNLTYHPVIPKLKNVISEMRLLLTTDREHGKVFEAIPIFGFRRAKSLMYILVREKVLLLNRRKALAYHVEVLSLKYTNML